MWWNWGGNWEVDPRNLLNNVSIWILTETEKTDLINQYGEEKMAKDLYNYAYEKYGIQTFSNIAKSEQRHMDMVWVLLERYNIEKPVDYAADNELYQTLKEKIDKSVKDALEAGVMVEITDIDNIKKDFINTDKEDIKIILSRIWWASFNHLRAFIRWLKNFWFETDQNYQKYLSEDEIYSRWPLTYKFAEMLENEWFILSENYSSTNIKNMCNWKTDNDLDL